jgi:hypothetical protein
VNLARCRKIKFACFLSYVQDSSKYKYNYCHTHIPTNTHTHTHTHTHTPQIHAYMQNMFPKVGQLDETNEGGKEEKNDRE